jgi:hypothetical protein
VDSVPILEEVDINFDIDTVVFSFDKSNVDIGCGSLNKIINLVVEGFFQLVVEFLEEFFNLDKLNMRRNYYIFFIVDLIKDLIGFVVVPDH